MSEPQEVIETPPMPARPFTVESIEAQIKRAWVELGARAEEASAPAPLRTSILTLVIVADGTSETRRAHSTLDRLMRVLPSRIILISVRDDAGGLSATASAHCPIHRHDRVSCFELIEINAPSADLRAIPSILTQLEIADLPTFIWWVGAVDISSGDFRRISAAAKRIIIDSSRFEVPIEAFAGYSQYLREHSAIAVGTDLAWGRLLILRELIAQSFDDPAARDTLAELRRIDMTFHRDATADALLMAGWLSSRLGWEPGDASEGTDLLAMSARKPDGRLVQFNLSPVAGPRRELRAVRLIAHSATVSSRVTVRRTDAMRAAVSIQMTTRPSHQRIVHCADRHDDEILGSELLQFGRDPIYEEALDHAAMYAGMLSGNRMDTA